MARLPGAAVSGLQAGQPPFRQRRQRADADSASIMNGADDAFFDNCLTESSNKIIRDQEQNGNFPKSDQGIVTGGDHAIQMYLAWVP
jgi:hypothetical protein